MQHSLHIYHINDVHSHFENWPQIVHYVKEKRREHEAKGEYCLFFDIGDFVDRFHPISEASHGKWNTELLNLADVNAVTIGNNEGITLSHEHLDELYDNRQFEVLVGNLSYLNGTKPPWLKPYTIFNFPSLRVGVIGLTIPFTGLYGQLGWKIHNPKQSLRKIIDEISSQVDYLILLSHLGIQSDEEIGENFPEVNLILGGHTHHVLQEGQRMNDTLLCGAGKYGMFIGHVEVTYDDHLKLHHQASLISTDKLIEVDFPTMSYLQQLEKMAENQLMNHVVTLDEQLLVDWYNETPLISDLAKSIRRWCRADIGMVNAGVLLNSLSKGIVTKKDIHEMCPHPINPCVISIPGTLLQDIIEKASTEKMETLKIKGLGFRGKVMGKMVYDGVVLNANGIYINGELLQSTKIYRLGTLDMFTFGYIFPELAQHEITYFMPELLRDVVEWQLRKG